MRTLGQRVEAYCGDILATSGVPELVSAWLTFSARRVLSNASPQFVTLFETPVTIPTAGLNVTSLRLMSVTSLTYWPSRQIPHWHSNRSNIEGSSYQGTTLSPVHYFKDGKLFVYPSGLAHVVRLPDFVSYEMNVIPEMDKEMEEVVVLDTSRSALLYILKTAQEDLTNFSAEVFTAPTAPADPSFSDLDDARLSMILSLAEQYQELAQYLDTDQDLELARGKMEEAQVRIAEFRVNLEGALAGLDKDLKKDVDEYLAKLRKFEAEVQLFLAKHTGQNQYIAALVARANALLAEKSKRLEFINALLMQQLQHYGIVAPQAKEAAQ